MNASIAARRCGGAAMAVRSAVTPMPELPYTPTPPSHHGCAAHHSTVSYPSAS